MADDNDDFDGISYDGDGDDGDKEDKEEEDGVVVDDNLQEWSAQSHSPTL